MGYFVIPSADATKRELVESAICNLKLWLEAGVGLLLKIKTKIQTTYLGLLSRVYKKHVNLKDRK